MGARFNPDFQLMPTSLTFVELELLVELLFPDIPYARRPVEARR